MFSIDKQSICNGLPLQMHKGFLKIYFMKDEPKYDKHKGIEQKSIFLKIPLQSLFANFNLHKS